MILSRRKSQVTSPKSEQLPEPRLEPVPCTGVPDYSDQKEPDSSFRDDEPLITSNTPPKKYPPSPERRSNRTPLPQSLVDASIQVDKVSSTDSSDDSEDNQSQPDVNTSSDPSMDETITDLDSSSSSSSGTDILEDDDEETEDNLDHSIVDESTSNNTWLQDVPRAERFIDEVKEEFRPITTRSVSSTSTENSKISRPASTTALKRKSKSILRSEKHSKPYTNVIHQVEKRRTRRHSTGQHHQRNQQQRRSLTPKVLVNRSLDEANKRSSSNGVLSSDSRHNGRFGNPLESLKSKKRNRSEDNGDGTDENNPENQKITDEKQHRWSGKDSTYKRSREFQNLVSECFCTEKTKFKSTIF